jgi:hypothetical protein
MVSVQDWKTVKCAETEDADHIRAIEALASLLEGNTSPSDAAKAITKTYEASLKAIEGSSKKGLWYNTKVHQFWGIYMSNAIRSFGSAQDHERLFELLVEISGQDNLEDYDGIVMTSIDHKTFWVDLPGWGRHFVDDGLCKFKFSRQFCGDSFLTE